MFVLKLQTNHHTANWRQQQWQTRELSESSSDCGKTFARWRRQSSMGNEPETLLSFAPTEGVFTNQCCYVSSCISPNRLKYIRNLVQFQHHITTTTTPGFRPSNNHTGQRATIRGNIILASGAMFPIADNSRKRKKTRTNRINLPDCCSSGPQCSPPVLYRSDVTVYITGKPWLTPPSQASIKGVTIFSITSPTVLWQRTTRHKLKSRIMSVRMMWRASVHRKTTAHRSVRRGAI